MEKPQYYDGTKLLSLLDLDGNKPEIYLCTTNRTGGKTTYFSKVLFQRFLRSGSKFCLIYRYGYQLESCADNFFKVIKSIWFSQYYMTSKPKTKGKYYELYVSTSPDNEDAKHCGYAIALNDSEFIKNNSSLFSDVDIMLFDEFQSESSNYCTDELTKFKSIHTSIARGNGEQCRYVPVIMLSNQVSIINPYYTSLGICDRLQEDTNFLKGHGFVLENGFVETASRAQLESGFNKAFGGDDDNYVNYSSQNVYLNDSMAFIEKPNGKGRYIVTLKYKNREYAIREFRELGYLYCDDRVDVTFKNKISVTTDDHNINYVMLKTSDTFITTLRWYFDHGAFRFKDLRCKEALLRCISY